MGRAPRIDIDGARHHVMNRGAGRQATFRCDEDRVEFGQLLGLGHERFGVVVHAYCLMTNHYHLLLHCPRGGLADFMHLVGSRFVRHANERSGRDGPLFRSRYRSVAVRDDAHLLATARYIHRNALDLPGVHRVDGYRWSSHRAYLGHRRVPPWMCVDDVLAHFGGNADAFHRFVAEDTVVEPARGRDTDIATVASVTELALEEFSDRLAGARQGVGRTLMLLVADRLAPSPAAESILDHLGSAYGVARDAAIRRARRRASAAPELTVIADRILDLLP